ncbi:MAG: aminotransferase class IV [Owenweeksia sp.]|nr:aminotransferase class IV [Owenweeksia sp.]
MRYNFNGEITEGPELIITTTNRALNYGDGVFESIKYAHNRLNFWEDHYFRLMAGMRVLRMEIPMSFSPEYLEEQVRKTLVSNELEQLSARVKIIVYRKEGGRYTPVSNEVDFMITTEALSPANYAINENGLTVDLFKDYYTQKSLLSTLKSTSAVLYTVASIFRNENDLDECLLLNDDKHVAEAISANVFMVKGQTVYTPPLEAGCLKGVMRKQVMELLTKMDYEVKEESFSPFELQRADELFLTNATQGIRWVQTYRKKKFESTCSRALVQRLNVKVAIG